ncbi:uncharacterized protein LOC129892297 [Solanum dulcamara]|uniref:uncharacterized protein LOC129892297 n=1 Tax=Solanum dulcamara TaxID=45834 RepID=UPI0024855C58|nr:uncharacterized protein LOC129892297 [Solanum dulcamara]XP_055823841.1 uncharacterized protein LOC129892297 [Solanum dulcamara]
MPGRSSKVRRKEAAKTKKFEKLPRIGLAMTCSNCNGRVHNKRGCPQSLESSAKEEPSNSGRERSKTSSSGRGIGRPKKPTRDEGEPPAKRGRGRPRKETAVPSASPPPTAPRAYSVPNAPPPPIGPVDYPVSSSAPPDFIATTNKKGRGSTTPY